MERFVVRRRGYPRPGRNTTLTNWTDTLWQSVFELGELAVMTFFEYLLYLSIVLIESIKPYLHDLIIFCAAFYFLMFFMMTLLMLLDMLATNLKDFIYLTFQLSIWVWMIYLTKSSYDNCEGPDTHVKVLTYYIFACLQHILVVAFILSKINA